MSEFTELMNYLNKHSSGKLEDNRATLKDIIHVLADLIEYVADAKIKIPHWQYHSQTLIGKIVVTSLSMLNISDGSEYGFFKRKGRVKIIDYPSLRILARALIENYVTLCYIYYNSLPEEEKIFRYKLWEVSGLISRQNFEVSSDEILKQKEEEKRNIERIMKEIQDMPDYKKLDQRQLYRLKRHGLPYVNNWYELIESSNLNKEYFPNCYSLFSNYAHSEFLSMLQISQSSLNSNDPLNISHVKMTLGIVRMICSLTIEYYVLNYKSAEIVYSTYPAELRSAIKIWQGAGKGRFTK